MFRRIVFPVIYMLLFICTAYAQMQCDDSRCWHTLNFGEHSVRAYDKRSTTPSICIQDTSGQIWYVNMVLGMLPQTLHAQQGTEIYSATDALYEIVDGRLVWAHPDIYLQSSGTQYIDTGITPSDTLGLRFDYLRESGTSDHVLIGSQLEIGSAVPEYARFTLGQSNSPYYGWNTYRHTGLSITERYLVNMNYMNSREVTYNGAVVKTGLETHVDNPYPIYVFCTNRKGTASVCSKIKVYSAILTDGAETVMHLVPVPSGLQIGDFTVPSNGMFDIISQKFYGNSGTGDFEFGTDY